MLGGLLVWAAGNTAINWNWGNRDADNVIAVGSTTSLDTRSSFSGFGHSVDVMAPGSSIYTTRQNSGYGSASGTSFATPLTAGLIAMIWSINPILTPDEVELVLKESCDDLGPAGVDEEYAYGRINLYNALTHPLVSPINNPPPSPGTYLLACGSTHTACSGLTQPAETSELHEVRCCADNNLEGWTKHANCDVDVWGESEINGVCEHAVTYQQALSMCASIGGRLCTATELLSDCTRGSGCQHD